MSGISRHVVPRQDSRVLLTKMPNDAQSLPQEKNLTRSQTVKKLHHSSISSFQSLHSVHPYRMWFCQRVIQGYFQDGWSNNFIYREKRFQKNIGRERNACAHGS